MPHISQAVKSILSLRTVFALCLLVCLNFNTAQAQEPPPEQPRTISGAKDVVPFLDRFMDGDQDIILQADSIEYDNETEQYRASGRVSLTQGDIYLRADQLLIDQKGGSITADGHVSLGNEDGALTSESIHLELRPETGVIVQGRMVVKAGKNNFYFSGERIEKTGPAQYYIQNGTYSSCDCEEGDEADWIIEAKEINLTLDGYAVIRHGRYITFGHPVAWIPYGVFPAKISRQTGFLYPELGWANDDGYRAGIPFYWAIDPSNDMTIYTDYMTNRGLKEGLEYRYAYSHRWKGQFNMDVLGYDKREQSERWAVAYEHQQNVWRRMYLRSRMNFISDNAYVNDFPSDIKARYNQFLRSNIIFNNLWENFDFNLDMELYDDLTQEDNAHTWQNVPEAKLNGAFYPFAGPLSYKLDITATQFYRDKPTEEETELDELAGHTEPFTYLSDGQRYEITPELLAPLSFNRYAYLTPLAGGYGTVYYLPQREDENSPGRALYFTGGDLHTELERVFTIHRPGLRGIKHSIQPGVSYLYFPDSYPQDDLPIFDGRDRHMTENSVTYYFDNRFWFKLFNRGRRSFHTLKFFDLRLSQNYDFHEAQRNLDPEIENDELRPFSPVMARLEIEGSAGSWLNRVLLRSDAFWDVYDSRVSTYNILGALGSRNDDLLGIEYRYHVQGNSDVVDIDYLSGTARYTLFEVLTFGAVAKYSFLDDYFIERIYSVRFNSLQHCWTLETQVEQREIPENETVIRMVLDLTGLVSAATAF